MTTSPGSIFKVSSQHRKSGETPQNFSVNFDSAIPDGTYALHELCLPVSWYNINSTNNKIVFYYYLLPRTATIPPGYYNTSNITTAIKTAMEAAAGSGTFTVTYDSLTSKFTITHSLDIWTIVPGETGTCHSMLGFSESAQTPATSQTSDGVVNLAYPLSINIFIDGATSTISDSKSNPTFTVPITENSQSLMIYRPDPVYPITVKLNRMSRVSVRLLADNYQSLDMNGCDFYFMLRKL